MGGEHTHALSDVGVAGGDACGHERSKGECGRVHVDLDVGVGLAGEIPAAVGPLAGADGVDVVVGGVAPDQDLGQHAVEHVAEGGEAVAAARPVHDGHEVDRGTVGGGVEGTGVEAEWDRHQHDHLGRLAGAQAALGEVVEVVERRFAVACDRGDGAAGLRCAPRGVCLGVGGDGEGGVERLEAGEVGHREAAGGLLLSFQPVDGFLGGRGAGHGRR
jgi:hypothetical protein